MDLQSYKQRLLAKEQGLEDEIAHLKTDALESRTAEVEDSIDSVVSATGQTTAFEESSLASDTLAAVRAALRRIEDGTFGTCLDCGAQIDEIRLKAVPWTSYCVRDQEKHDAAAARLERDYFEAAL